MATATATAASSAEQPWINATEAASILATNYQNVRRLAADGRITTRKLPGTQMKYSRRSVQRLAESVLPAGETS